MAALRNRSPNNTRVRSKEKTSGWRAAKGFTEPTPLYDDPHIPG
jgi:hypothetical protein